MEISVENQECTIAMVKDVVSLSQMSLPNSQPLPTEEEAVSMDGVQAPRDCGIAIELAPNKIKEFAVLHERSHFVSVQKLLELAGSN